VGYGNRTLEELLELLSETGITVVVDIRANPQSKLTPDFSQEYFRLAIEQTGLSYHWAGLQLGGNRRARFDSQHITLQDETLRGFADYMETDTFQISATQLINIAQQDRTAMMSAEILPAGCHRSLISDYLVLKGINIIHLLSEDNLQEHLLSEFARRESYELVYDRKVLAK